MEKEKPPARKVDIFAGKGSLADRLKKRRQAVESGTIEDENTREKIIERGYKKHRFDEEEPND